MPRDAQECINGHIFCKSCISVWESKNSKCPVCRTVTAYLPKMIGKFEELTVKCIECGWRGNLNCYSEHEKRHRNNTPTHQADLNSPPKRRKPVNDLRRHLDAFASELERRKRAVERFYIERERKRRQYQREVNLLSRQLDFLADDLIRANQELERPRRPRTRSLTHLDAENVTTRARASTMPRVDVWP